ncbi:hypothetical protein F3Y22_tig00117056pilonHSYRG00291 [Hibiscus syriacus]|uniref:UCH catalytic domain-containing protein n=1 Tax=Hibiscus syriacus TaxID=106335 RepID=A0A6A2X654_HIBSY|nr:hypothetical protein F3Y22_tig00117056pilonHSYRG00291 [Hibiscus syriacus]
MQAARLEAECCDVYGLDDELLAMVPQPVLAVLFLFPITSQTEEERLQQDNEKRVSAIMYSSSVFCIRLLSN